MFILFNIAESGKKCFVPKIEGELMNFYRINSVEEIEEVVAAQKNYTSKLEAEIRSLKQKLKEQGI